MCANFLNNSTQMQNEDAIRTYGFQNLTLDALMNTGALVNCISEANYRKIHQMSPKDIVKEMEPPPFKWPSRKWRYWSYNTNNTLPNWNRELEHQRDVYYRSEAHWTHTRAHIS